MNCGFFRSPLFLHHSTLCHALLLLRCKQVIAYHTLGIDVSRLFTEMMLAIETRYVNRKGLGFFSWVRVYITPNCFFANVSSHTPIDRHGPLLGTHHDPSPHPPTHPTQTNTVIWSLRK